MVILGSTIASIPEIVSRVLPSYGRAPSTSKFTKERATGPSVTPSNACYLDPSTLCRRSLSCCTILSVTKDVDDAVSNSALASVA